MFSIKLLSKVKSQYSSGFQTILTLIKNQNTENSFERLFFIISLPKELSNLEEAFLYSNLINLRQLNRNPYKTTI